MGRGIFALLGAQESEMAVAGFSQPLRFPGQYEDAESGLYYNVWRYYDPDTGRYTRTDPLGLLGGDVNLYRYVGGNPVMGVDELGLNQCEKLPPKRKEGWCYYRGKWQKCTLAEGDDGSDNWKEIRKRCKYSAVGSKGECFVGCTAEKCQAKENTDHLSCVRDCDKECSNGCPNQ